MRIESREKWWQFEIVVERGWARKAVTPVKNYSEEATALLALSAVITGVLTVFIAAWLWPLRMVLSILTLLSAIFATKRVVSVNVSATGLGTATGEATVEVEENTDGVDE